MKPHRILPPVCRKGPKAQKVFQRHFKGQEETSDTCGLQWVRNAELGPGDSQGLGEGKGKAAEAITHAVSYTIKQPAWKWVCLIFLLSFLSICTWGVCMHARALLSMWTHGGTHRHVEMCVEAQDWSWVSSLITFPPYSLRCSFVSPELTFPASPASQPAPVIASCTLGWWHAGHGSHPWALGIWTPVVTFAGQTVYQPSHLSSPQTFSRNWTCTWWRPQLSHSQFCIPER